MRTLAVLVLAILATAAFAADTKAKEPGRKSKGKTYQWQAKDGLVYWYYIPKKYDPEKGANLTLILHGSNLKAGWGFWNHKAGEFRPDDVVVSPDGTTPNGSGGFNFMGQPKDAKRLHALHKELKQLFRINATFLYGHSQGSFFSLYYAGIYPDDVQGVVAHASGFWGGKTQFGKKYHHQAIVYMHGTQDPVVPYWQSVGGYRVWKKAKYPMVRLRSLERWNHWPAEHNGDIRHTSQQLAWVEGMTTDNPKRLAVAFNFLANCKVKERTDYAAVYSLSKRIQTLPFATPAVRRRADKAVLAIEKLAAAHVKALKTAKKFDGKPWIIQLPLFLRQFHGVPAREELATTWKKTLDKQEKQALTQINRYWNSRKPSDKFAAAVKAIKAGYLYFRCHDSLMLKKLKGWRKDAKQNKLSKAALKDYDALVPKIEKASKDAYRAFHGLNRKVGGF